MKKKEKKNKKTSGTRIEDEGVGKVNGGKKFGEQLPGRIGESSNVREDYTFLTALQTVE